MTAALIAGFFSGVAASMGLGGGFVLLMYLTAIAEVGQLQAQGINLLFFLPIAALSVFLHRKNGLVEKKPLFPAIGFGALGVAIGAALAFWFPTGWLSKLFALLVLALGVRELLHKKTK